MELEKEKAEKDLKELMARFKLRKALLHWRHRKLTLSFRAIVTMCFKPRCALGPLTMGSAGRACDLGAACKGPHSLPRGDAILC